jgi:hypothetical protein
MIKIRDSSHPCCYVFKKTVLQSNLFLLVIKPLKAENEKEGDKMADIKYKPITTDIAAGASITVIALVQM